ncbi:chain length determinant protein [Clostridiales bacterium KLE1615]|nr:chain length determinant protein [Clostridiales bacterium KLE1615]
MEMEKKVSRSQPQTQDVIDLVEVFHLLLHKWKLLFVAILAGSVLGGAYCTFLLETTYRAEASLYITSSESLLSFSELQLSSALTEDYAYIIKSRTVLERVIDELGLDMDYKQLGDLVGVTNPDSSHVISISVTTMDPEMSRNIANSLLNVSVEQINQIVGNGMPSVIDESVIRAVVTQKPSMAKYIVLGAMLGFVLAAGILIVRMLMDTTIKSEDDVERYLGVPLLSSILKKYGFHIMQGNREYITANELRKINKRYSIERAFQLTKVTPVKRPQLIIGG